MSKDSLHSVETDAMKHHKQNECSNKENNSDDDDDGDVDPINAYFKQRLHRSSTRSNFNQRESYSDSSLGVLDIDNMSLLDEMGRYSSSSSSKKIQDDLNCVNNEKISKKTDEYTSSKPNASSCDPSTVVTEPPESELKIRKQRELAKKNLLQLNSRLENCLKNLKTLYDNTGEPLMGTEKKNVSSNLSAKMNMPKWFEINQSPHTPRYFVDELNSLCDSSETTPVVPLADSITKANTCNESVSTCDQVKNKGIISPPDDTKVFNASEFIFETQNPDEILNRLEEDQKKFLKDQSAISNNSNISNFSGITEDKVRPWHSSSVVESPDNNRISIGKYFQLRSYSINSLVGSKGSAVSEPNVIEKDDLATLTPNSTDKPLENGTNNQEKLSEERYSWKNNLKRWHSSFELKGNEEKCDSSAVKHSIESAGSTSTLLIQDLLRGMESGLSGTQINDRLLECLGKTTTEKKLLNQVESMETPKSTRIGGRIGTLRNSSKRKADAGRLPLVSDLTENQVKSPLAGKKSISKSCSQFSETEFKENAAGPVRPRSKFHKNLELLKKENIIKEKPFVSSTPKYENVRSGGEKLKPACSKLLISDVDWGVPRVSSIRKPKSLNDSSSGEDCEKTVVLNTTVMSDKKKRDMSFAGKDSRSIEDTIAAGDLTIVSERIKDMKKDDRAVNSSFRGEEDILLVVQELAGIKKGSVDCSALTPLLRNHFPELLSTFSLGPDRTKSFEDSYDLGLKAQETIPTVPGHWAKISSKWQCGEVCIAVDVEKVITIQIKNHTEDWLIISLDSMFIQCPSDVSNGGKNLTASKMKDGFHIGDFLSVSMRDTLISPGAILPCKVRLIPKVPVILPIKLRFGLKKLITKENQTQDLSLKIKCLFPRNNIIITPSNDINFGIIPADCSEEKIVNVSFDGACDLPLKVYIDKSDSFILSPKVTLNGERMKKSAWRENIFYCNLKEGVKTVLQFKLIFRPRATLDNSKNRKVDMKAALSVGMETPSDNCILRQVQLHGSVAFTKFLCLSSAPLIFRVTGKGNSVKKSFPLKNIGAVELKFTLSVACENSEEQTDGLFTVPNTFTLPKDEERYFDVVFNGDTSESYVKRNLILQMEPNGMCYEVELTGVVMPVMDGRAISRTSSHSGPSHSMYNPGNFLFHIKSTAQTINWPAIPLDIEMKHTFFVMNSSNCNAMARFSFKKETSSFKFLNDNGESIEKLRKLLKPNCSNAMTVIFRPNCIGPHINSIIIETNNLSGRKMISLNGYGGSSKIFVRNLKSDLNGSKIVRLINSEPENQIFHATLEFVNKGNISGFVSIKTMYTVLSLSNLLEIKPSNFVVAPNSKTDVKIIQKLRNNDLKQLLPGKDICKLAALTVTTGDEPSRLRLKKLARDDKVKTAESLSFLLDNFINEIGEELEKFTDDERFESVFRKSLDTLEVAAVIERPNDECESTIVEVAEETMKEFVTILPAADTSVASLRVSDNEEPLSLRKFNLDKSNLSSSSGGSLKSRNRNVSKWLETLEKP